VGDTSGNWTKFGRYALLEQIGSGGMAEIHRAKTFGAAGFEKEYAIKLIIPSLVDDTEFVDMFINEAKIVVNLYHANIVQVFDLGEIDDQYYIAMEYVHGKDLLDILARCAKRGVQIPLNMVLFVTMEMLKGLNFAHQAKDPYGEDLNIIHRDISPSNIMISYAGDVKVGDFGVAKAAIQRSLSDNDTLKGKVGYMSPEQVMGEPIDHRSDIFSAGIVLFEALSMSRLFVGDSDLDVMLKVRDADIEEAFDRIESVPDELKSIVRRALRKDPDERYQTAGDFYQALVDFTYQRDIKVTGNDLSNLMHKLFAEEIEEEKTRRRQDPKTPPPEIVTEEAGAPNVGQADSTSESGIIRPASSVAHDDTEASADEPGPAGDRPTTRPGTHAGVSTQSEDADGEGLDLPTMDVEDDLYRFKSDEGEVRGPMSHSKIIQLLQHRRPRPDDRVSVANGPWKRPEDVNSLDDLIPAYADAVDNSQPGGQEPEDKPAGAQVFRRGPKKKGEDDADDLYSDTDVDRSEAREESTGVRNLEATVQEMERMRDASSSETSDETGDEAANQSGIPGTYQFESTTAEDSGAAGLHGPTEASVGSDDTLQSGKTEPTSGDPAEEMRDQYVSYEGNLEQTPFPRVFGRLHLTNATGRLYVRRDPVEKSIFFRQGELILVESSKRDELLGSFLLSRGVINEEQLDKALERLHEWGGRLGDALVAIGAVPAHDIYELLSDQMREKILDIFTWQRGYFGYYEGQEPDTKGYPLGVEALDVVVEGCRNRVPFGYLVDFYEGRLRSGLKVNERPPVDLDRLKLSTREMRVLNHLKKQSNLADLLDSFPSTQKSRVYRIVYLMDQLNVVEFSDDNSSIPDL
jgi:serine/threonine protein kinase